MFLDCFSRRAPCKNDFGDKKTDKSFCNLQRLSYMDFLSLLFPDPSPSGSSYQPAHSRNCYYTCDLKATCVCDALFGTHRCWCLDGYVGSGHTGKCRSKFTTNSINKNQTQILKDFLTGGGGGEGLCMIGSLIICLTKGQSPCYIATREDSQKLLWRRVDRSMVFIVVAIISQIGAFDQNHC